MKKAPLHYSACGLDDVYLLNGFTVSDSSRGEVTKIKDIDGLHRAIGGNLVRQKRSLNGKELRFLRTELGLSQANLSTLLGESKFAKTYGFTAARVRDWEQGRSRPDGALRAYLMVIQKEPKAVKRALAS